MIKGIGLDIITIDRINNIYQKHPSFATKILTPLELEIFNTLNDYKKLEYLAGRFSAKEALSKAFGTGIGKQLSFLDISVLNDKLGKPYIICSKINVLIHVTITHFNNLVASQVILEEKNG